MTTYKAYASTSSKEPMPTTLITALGKERARTGQEPRAVVVSVADAAALTGPLGTVVTTDAAVPVGQVWFPLGEGDGL